MITFEPETAKLAAQEKYNRYLDEATEARMIAKSNANSTNWVAFLAGRANHSIKTVQHWLMQLGMGNAARRRAGFMEQGR